MNFVEIFLAVMTSLGGFVDVGELVFTAQAGAKFGYSVIWAVALGTVGIVVYSEMAGRIAAVRRKAVFDVIRDELPRPLSRVTLFASTAVNLITCAAELGGMSVVLRLLLGIPFHTAVLVSTLSMLAVIAFLPFRWIERFFGVLGLAMLTFAFAVFRLSPEWPAIARGLVPQVPPLAPGQGPVYAYFVIGIFSSVMMAYEVYFYASGGIEDHWKKSDTPMNALIAGVGLTLGSALSIALVVLGKVVFQPDGIRPEFIDTVALAAAVPFGRAGLVLGLVGMLFAISGAAAETAMAGAYDYAQYFGLPWGRAKTLREAPKFNLAWAAMLVGGMLITLTGVDPVNLVEYAVIFSAVVLPLTYWPILRVAGSRQSLGEQAEGVVMKALGWVFLVLVTVAAVAGVPLLFLTHAGRG